MRLRAALCLLAIAPALAAGPAPVSGVETLYRSFQAPPDDARIMMRWWWFGPAVTKAGLEREMRLMKEAGVGGFEVQPVYPLALDDAQQGIRNLPFLSGDFLEALRFTSETARRLGLRMDLTLGSGWPYGGPGVPVSEAAGSLRRERLRTGDGSRRVPLPATGAGEAVVAVFLGHAAGDGNGAQNPREINDVRDGAVWLPEDVQGPAELEFFIASRTGMMVKRAAVGAEGFVLDHYDRRAVENYLRTVGGKLLQALAGSPPQAVFCDSLEVFGSDWTAGFPEAFRKRRGYDIRPHLPAMFRDAGPRAAAVRHDWGRTLTELVNENFLAPMQEWSKRNRTLFRAQTYGMPPAALSSHAFVDLPEGEGFEWKTLSASRWASSASHLYGRPVTSSETWTWLHSPAFRASPLDLKAEADLHFLQGINQLIGHGWPYTPEGVAYPGWSFYAAGAFNEKNPWWLVMPDLSLYLQRISFLMRQGKPVSDVACYLPNSDAWSRLSPGRVDLRGALGERIGPGTVARVLEAGFNLDFFDDGALEQLGRIEGNALVMGENRYRIVLLPGVERIPLSTVRFLEKFSRAGGSLIATRRLPALAPGFMAKEEEHAEIRETARRLFDGPAAPAILVANEDEGLAPALASRLQPDVVLSPAAPEIGFAHRSTAGAEIYFVVNTANTARHVRATFRVEGLHPQWWDPFTGRASAAEVAARPPGGTTIPLELDAYGSRVLVFSAQAAGSPNVSGASPVPPPLDLSAGWRVSFGSNSSPRVMDRLRSWTEDPETRYYSGLGVYEKEVNVPEAFLDGGVETRLDFGEARPLPPAPLRTGMQAWLDGPVREAAVVYVNGSRAGSVWRPPYSVDVTGLLRRGENRIRVVVGNLAVNHLAGRRLPDYRLLHLRYGVRFEPQDWDKLRPEPSGLLGPIRLIASPRPQTNSTLRGPSGTPIARRRTRPPRTRPGPEPAAVKASRSRFDPVSLSKFEKECLCDCE